MIWKIIHNLYKWKMKFQKLAFFDHIVLVLKIQNHMVKMAGLYMIFQINLPVGKKKNLL